MFVDLKKLRNLESGKRKKAVKERTNREPGCGMIGPIVERAMKRSNMMLRRTNNHNALIGLAPFVDIFTFLSYAMWKRELVCNKAITLRTTKSLLVIPHRT